jgi:hypothetical protein
VAGISTHKTCENDFTAILEEDPHAIGKYNQTAFFLYVFYLSKGDLNLRSVADKSFIIEG